MTQEGVGTVDRIDHPNPRPGEPLGAVLGLFRQPAVIWAGALELALQQRVGREIRFAHLRAVELLLHRNLLPEVGQRKRAGISYHGLK